jgi:hypothetical protein
MLFVDLNRIVASRARLFGAVNCTSAKAATDCAEYTDFTERSTTSAGYGLEPIPQISPSGQRQKRATDCADYTDFAERSTTKAVLR